MNIVGEIIVLMMYEYRRIDYCFDDVRISMDRLLF